MDQEPQPAPWRQPPRFWQSLFTIRGAALFVLSFWLLLIPARMQADIVASVSGLLLLGVLLTLAVLSHLLGRRLRAELSLRVSCDSLLAHSAGVQVAAGSPAVLMMRLSPVRILPLWVLEIQAHFREEPLPAIAHRCSGSFSQPRFITEQLTFPHRGRWNISTVRCSVRDQLGFTHFTWDCETPESKASFTVHPPACVSQSFPVLSSARRSGDDALDMNERQGEPFDLKPYHPSDGVRKIHWKVYARRGELISRHPERAITPEGLVSLFCVASPGEDLVCAQLLSYMHQLEELDLQLVLGCEGMGPRPLARNTAQAEALLIDSVWDSRASSPRSSRQELERLLAESRKVLGQGQLESVVIFFARDRLVNKPNLAALIELGAALDAQGVRPVFIPVHGQQGTDLAADSIPQPELPQSIFSSEVIPARVRAFGRRMLLVDDQPVHRMVQDLSQEFFRLCATQRWTVIV